MEGALLCTTIDTNEYISKSVTPDGVLMDDENAKAEDVQFRGAQKQRI